MGKNKEWLTKAEAAERLGVHPATLDRWRREGRITRYTTPGVQNARFRLSEIDALFIPDALTKEES
ncbi:MAG: helix-turn-helix domain-containing protein [Chitinophagaceae bacterium]|nr:MAG: helix-turn-helix domain-containing protein [Chitinophagaceae bacterium]